MSGAGSTDHRQPRVLQRFADSAYSVWEVRILEPPPVGTAFLRSFSESIQASTDIG